MTSADHFTLTFHIGAHKTATTHLQRSLEHAQDALIDAGVRYYGPAHFRLPGRSMDRLFGLRKDLPPRRAPQDQLALMRKGAARLLISEENFIGRLNAPRKVPITARYPRAAARIAALAEATKHEGLEICFAIRQPTTFLNSGYSQQLLGGKITSSAEYLRLHPLEAVDWYPVVAGLVEIEAVRRLTVWRYEDYGALFPDICAALVGAGAADLVTPFHRRSHAGLSAKAVEVIFDNRHDSNISALASRSRRDYPIGDAFPAFDHFDPATHELVASAYADQCTQIAALPKVRFLRPTV